MRLTNWLALLALSAGTTAAAAPLAAYTLLGDRGATVARAVTSADVCPAITVDGRRSPMTVRATAETLPQRPTALAPVSKPSAFPVRTCEAVVVAGAHRADVDGHRLALPRARITRIVVIGDTGCRLKGAVAQACNDPAQFPFAAIAAHAAAWHPQLVVHVGDYLYRETPCPGGNVGCAGSPWGYGWDAWAADLFTPGAPLLAAAPWVVVRGNHESCVRAGQGWWRLLDPRPMVAGRDCNDAGNDATGDAASAYAVPIGDHGRVIVVDLAAIGDGATARDDPRFADTARVWDDIARLSAGGGFTFLTTHKPILGFVAAKGNAAPPRTLTDGITSVFATRDAHILPATVDVVLSGHEHVWEQVSYGGALPSQFVTGFSGTQEDIVPLPATLPPGLRTAGFAPDHFSSWVDGFGYMTLERRGGEHWRATVRNVRGDIVNRCTIDGRQSSCARRQVAAAPAGHAKE